MDAELVSADEFRKRLSAICRGADSSLPRRRRDRHIVFRGIAQALHGTASYSEPSLNEALKQWMSDVGWSQAVDHVTLRRYLIDARYLHREMDGTSYRVEPEGSGEVAFDPAVFGVDAVSVVREAQQRAAIRKRERRSRVS